MLKRPNLIYGSRPQFGNVNHIKWYKEKTEIMHGKRSFHCIEWERCNYWGKHTHTGKPIYNFDDSNAVVDLIPCPYCERLHVLLISYDPQGNWYDQLLQIDATSKEFSCWNCDLEFITDEDRHVYVNQTQFNGNKAA